MRFCEHFPACGHSIGECYSNRKLKPFVQTQQQYEGRAASKRKARFGITAQQYKAKLIEQQYVCAVCKEPQKKALAVDHCHDSNMIRGLLCTRCNLVLGHVKDSVTLLKDMATYLERYT